MVRVHDITTSLEVGGNVGGRSPRLAMKEKDMNRSSSKLCKTCVYLDVYTITRKMKYLSVVSDPGQ